MFKKILLFPISAILLFCVVLNPETSDAQQRPDVEFVQQFSTNQDELPRERVYLHTDRQWYFYGDRIWFSTYLTAGSFNALSPLSKVIYVELHSPGGDLINRIAIENVEGRGRGSIPIENDGAPGLYRLKAYTSWSLNFGESYGFSRDIPVHTDVDGEVADRSTDFEIGFFPEGGDLVYGLESRVGFKATGTDGRGVDVSGMVYNQNDEMINEFSSGHLGMGVFTITPEPGNRYYAEIEGERFELPEPGSGGIVFSVSENEHDQYFFRVRSSDKGSSSALLFGHVRGEVYLATAIDIDSGIGFTVAPQNMFPTGPVHFTVLSGVGLPLAERLKFNINPDDIVESTLESDDNRYALRERVDVSVALNEVAGDPVNGTASVTVFDDKLQTFNSHASTIETKLLLESDIAGPIENPGYYFETTQDHSYEADLLMLTQGWRAFDMDEVKPIEDIELYSLPEAGITLQGQVRSPIRGRGMSNANVVFSVGSDQEEMQLIETDEDGFFTITDLVVTGSQPVNLMANDKDGSDNVRIRISEPFSHLPDESQQIDQSNYSSLDFSSHGDTASAQIAPDEITERAEATQMQAEAYADVQMRGELEEIVVDAERDTDDQFERELRLRDAGSQRVDLDERPELKDLPVEVLLNQIPGVSAVRITGLTIDTGGGASFSLGSGEPLILLNGIQVDWDTLLGISPHDIQTINVFRRATELAAFGVRGAGGVVSVRTRRGANVTPASRGFTTAFVEGYQRPTRFYSPRYGSSVPRDHEEKDNRITLHWEPNIDIRNGQAQLSFWTNDVPSDYRVVIEGLTEFGIPFTETLTFIVEE